MNEVPGKHVFAVGAAIGLDHLNGLVFDLSRPYTCCRICGAVFQSDRDRKANQTDFDQVVAMSIRKGWSINHAKGHSDKEHLMLAYSGAWCTPEAAHKLAAFGIIAVSDAVRSNEHQQALAEAKAVMNNDVEGA